MTIKIVGIISSPRHQGNTAFLVRKALAGAKNNDAEVEEIFLPEYNLEFCKGCFTCLREGKCSTADDLETLREKLILSDGIIVSSPTHGLEPNAIMKNFMDRIGLFSVYTSLLADKYVASISTTGSIGAKKVAKKMTNINGGFMKTGYFSGILGIAIDWDHVKNYPEHLDKAYSLGETLVDDIRNEKKYYTQKLFTKIINALIIKKIMKKNILEHKDDRMKAVYNYLVKEGEF